MPRKIGMASVQVDIPDDGYQAIARTLEAINSSRGQNDQLKLSDAFREALANYFHVDIKLLQPERKKGKSQ